MKTNTQKIGLGLLVVGALLGVSAFFGFSLGGHGAAAPATQQSFGSTVVPNAQWFTGCVAYGNLSRLHCSDTISLGAGQNQVAWTNNTGQTISVQDAEVNTTGTASSTVKFYVGTSTKATVADSFNPATAPFWSQIIDAFSLATGTPSGLWADNIANHKTSFPGTVNVAAGQSILFVADSFCLTTGACETATSTNRGWTSMLNFEYTLPNQN